MTDVEVVVLGSGAAGLAGALHAALLGQSVVILEKSPVWGGSAAMSAGALWIPDNAKMGAVGISDSREHALAYLTAVTEGDVPAERLEAFLDGANRMIEVFEQNTGEAGVRFEPVREYPDYNTDQPGAKPGGRVLEPLPFDGRRLDEDFTTLHACYPGELIFDRFMMRIDEARSLLLPGLGPKIGLAAGMARYALRSGARRRGGGRDPYLTMGQALTSRLRAALRDKGVPLRLNCAARSLLTGNGRVVGVEDQNGERFIARNGVLLTTGGFERNDELRQRYQRHPVQAQWTVGHRDNTGDGLILAEHVGAALDTELMRDSWWAPAVLPPGEPTTWVLVIEKSLPYSIFVDRDGERFVNEAANYSDVGRAMYEAETKTGKAVPAWMVFDARFRRKFPIGPVKPGMMQSDNKVPDKLRPGNGWLHRADSIEALAASIGVPAATLAQTVDRFNGFARTGSDPDFSRGAILNDLHYTDPRVKPNPSLGPIEKAPFYAVQIVPGDLGTKAGVRTDTRGRVLDANGAPVAGLYAAGNVSSSVMGRSYPGAGGTLAPAMTFGFLAAEAMVSDASVKDA